MSPEKQEIIIIAAYAENRVIGKDGRIPWYIKEDMERFKQLTIPHPVIMGRKTYDSLDAKFKPLPKRKNIVVSKNSPFGFVDNLIVSRSVDEAIKKALELDSEIFIIGGQSIYEKTISLASKMYLTEIKLRYQGDSYFPEFDESRWQEIKREDHGSYDFVDYVRK